MKSKHIWWILTGLLVLFSTVSCRTTPPEEDAFPPADVQVQPPPPPPPPPVQDDRADLEALDAAAARAGAARQFVMDFDGHALFPSEWEAADSLCTQATQQRSTATPQEIQASTARYNAAADAFEAMTAQTLAQNFADMERELINARNAAVGAGAMLESPDFLLHADNTVLSAYEKYQTNDFHAARDAARNALAMYRTITALLESARIWEEIGMQVEELAPDLLSQAEDVVIEAGDKWDAGDYIGAEAGAVRGLSMFTALRAGLGAFTAWENVVDNAEELALESLLEAYSVAEEAYANWGAGNFYEARAGAELAMVMFLRAGASAERQNALNYRANVAAQPDFNAAQTVFNRAAAAYQARNLEEAASLFDESSAMFMIAAHIALERQILAEEALRYANERMAESDEAARTAERILEGGDTQ